MTSATGDIRACPGFFIAGQNRRAENRGRRQQAPSPPARGLGSAVRPLGGVWGGDPTARRFSTIFITQVSLSWHYNIVNCGLSRIHWDKTPCPLAYAPAKPTQPGHPSVCRRNERFYASAARYERDDTRSTC